MEIQTSQLWIAVDSSSQALSEGHFYVKFLRNNFYEIAVSKNMAGFFLRKPDRSKNLSYAVYLRNISNENMSLKLCLNV